MYEQLKQLMPLSDSFEYCAELGLNIRMNHYWLWEKFSQDVDLQRYPLAQSQGFKFIEYLENNYAEELLALAAPLLEHSSTVLKTEIQASLDCLTQEHTFVNEELPDIPNLDNTVLIYSNTKPLNKIPDWTQTALPEVSKVKCLPTTEPEQLIKGVHSLNYFRQLIEFSQLGGGRLTPETFVTPQSKENIFSSLAIMETSLQLGSETPEKLILCQTYPGSHHAARERGGGTCLVNNLAVAAGQAIKRFTKQAAILDIDAHHGNGSEQIFYENKKVLTASVHQRNPFFPGTGGKGNRGRGRGKGANFNQPVSQADDWMTAVRAAAHWVIRHNPGLILVEFSTDAHQADPVSELQASNADYYLLGKILASTPAVVIVELGASLSENAWIGGLRSFVAGYNS